MEKTINIDGKEVRLRATAAVPRLYRIKFGRDIMQDLAKLAAAYEKATTEQEQLAAPFADQDAAMGQKTHRPRFVEAGELGHLERLCIVAIGRCRGGCLADGRCRRIGGAAVLAGGEGEGNSQQAKHPA